MSTDLYPMTFTPVYKDYPWGGTRIPETYNRTDAPSGICAESWEISDHEDGMSVISNGPLAGKPLREALGKYPQKIMGTSTSGNRFPLLIKLIDAKNKLSVQVHPNDETAATFGGEAKTEMWYLLGDNPTQVYCGLKPDVTREQFMQAVDAGSCGETMNIIPVEKESAILIRGGRIHAIDCGCLILEIQQSSNTTYRIYDWNRMGNDGKPRELHIDKALEVINWGDIRNPKKEPTVLVETDSFSCSEILECEYFRLEKLYFNAPLEVPMNGTTFHALFVSEGAGLLEWDGGQLNLYPGISILVPAALPAYTLSGNATILRTTLPHS